MLPLRRRGTRCSVPGSRGQRRQRIVIQSGQCSLHSEVQLGQGAARAIRIAGIAAAHATALRCRRRLASLLQRFTRYQLTAIATTTTPDSRYLNAAAIAAGASLRLSGEEALPLAQRARRVRIGRSTLNTTTSKGAVLLSRLLLLLYCRLVTLLPISTQRMECGRGGEERLLLWRRRRVMEHRPNARLLRRLLLLLPLLLLLRLLLVLLSLLGRGA